MKKGKKGALSKLKRAEIDLSLHPKQDEAYHSTATEILYGGAAGGGKSHLLRAVAISACQQIPNFQCYIFRRLSPDLVKNHMEGSHGFRSILKPWEDAGYVQIVQDEIRFWNNSRIYLSHCQDEKDRYKYQGAEIHLLLMDELTHFTEIIYRYLRGRVRMDKSIRDNLPEQFKGRYPRIICASNPGNIGHLWVKRAFIDNAVPMEIRKMPPREGGFTRQFIPARLEDNPSLDEDYRWSLQGLGSPELVRALELGDWDVVEGAYFPEFSRDKHVIEPFPIPHHWLKFRSMDWGSTKPFSVGWYAVSDGTKPGIPANALVCYREWYGAELPDVGLCMTAEQVADGILDRECEEEHITYSVADPSIFKEDGGPSIRERMAKRGVRFKKGDRERLPGWDAVRQRLIGENDKSMIYWFKTCYDAIRTIPALQHDDSRPEDLDTKGEDHVGDQVRYACMSRPFRVPQTRRQVVKTIHNMSLDDLWANRPVKRFKRGRR